MHTHKHAQAHTRFARMWYYKMWYTFVLDYYQAKEILRD